MRRPAHVLLLALVPACYDPSGYETLLEYYTTEDSDSDSGSDDSANSSPPISTVTTEPPPHGSDSDSDSSSAGDTGDDTEGALPRPADHRARVHPRAGHIQKWAAHHHGHG
jgi:hypothetical protein